MDISQRIAEELNARTAQVEAAVRLLDEGATVPFIARYRKEVTGGLDDTQLRTLEERLIYLREMEERRATILKSIEEQGKLTPELNTAILAAGTKTRLGDLYAPYQPKRRTKAQIAREAGLEPVLNALLEDPNQIPESVAAGSLNPEKGFADAAAVLDGARQIFMEKAAEEADLVGALRDLIWEKGRLLSTVVPGKEQEGAKFSDYFEFSEPLKQIPSHRALALFRGRAEGMLRLVIQLPGQDDLESTTAFGVCDAMIARRFSIRDEGRPADRWLADAVRWAWRIKLKSQLDTESFLRLREMAEEEAIRVFGENLRDLLLAAPAGSRPTMGLDPGLRTGVKVAVVGATGKVLDHTAIFPHPPKNQWEESLAALAALARKHQVELISIGNGTASRETDKLAKELIKRHPELKLTCLVVSEAGASVYSASAIAAKEFPDLDVSYRGAVSIARRLQDPLAELVKIEPKAIGVGQYQHDVNQTRLTRKLGAVVEDCVNTVGVDVNTASAPLMARVAGLTETTAANIVAYREEKGAFRGRRQLLEVARLGPKAFEQSAGFLRIMNGENPLDGSAVHPEAYPVVERILSATGRALREVIGNKPFLSSLSVQDFIDEKFGEMTVRDILRELEKPGRDPRPEFKTAAFREGVETLADLVPGSVLEGVVTNVTNFGAFVDIGVHHDGLVHISAMSERFIKDPREVVKAGDVVKVKVMQVDLERKRVSLTMRLSEGAVPPTEKEKSGENAGGKKSAPKSSSGKKQPSAPAPMTTMADAFARFKERKP
ncbi:Tex family protein [Candidatus Manganitrophus noduliformans]|uniref:RNA-binding transcriptional accessory protein n=1 Tax=Candidatus Manganitrophus noduliformans TaxID=2606439 RepID=A0A7X6DLC2_9BACT|nr:Tex family protein [Candidatus Manganitrophus noduliformans]NKE69300.1 RNA-binding transcriptional accessory protein [Candidatus Manganitrophus noduliformans]